MRQSVLRGLSPAGSPGIRERVEDRRMVMLGKRRVIYRLKRKKLSRRRAKELGKALIWLVRGDRDPKYRK